LLTAQGMHVSPATLREYMRSARRIAGDPDGPRTSHRARRPAPQAAKAERTFATSDAAPAPSTDNPGATAGVPAQHGAGPVVGLASVEVVGDHAQQPDMAAATRAWVQRTTNEEGSREEEGGPAATERVSDRSAEGNADSNDRATQDAIGEERPGEPETATVATAVSGTGQGPREGSSMGSQCKPPPLESPVEGATLAPRGTKDEEEGGKRPGGDRAMEVLRFTQRPREEGSGPPTTLTRAGSFKVREDSEDL
jgi:hypothetical protein